MALKLSLKHVNQQVDGIFGSFTSQKNKIFAVFAIFSGQVQISGLLQSGIWKLLQLLYHQRTALQTVYIYPLAYNCFLGWEWNNISEMYISVQTSRFISCFIVVHRVAVKFVSFKPFPWYTDACWSAAGIFCEPTFPPFTNHFLFISGKSEEGTEYTLNHYPCWDVESIQRQEHFWWNRGRGKFFKGQVYCKYDEFLPAVPSPSLTI